MHFIFIIKYYTLKSLKNKNKLIGFLFKRSKRIIKYNFVHIKKNNYFFTKQYLINSFSYILFYIFNMGIEIALT